MKLNIFFWIESYTVIYNSKKERIIVIIKRKYKKEDDQCKLKGKAKMEKEEEKKSCTQMKIHTNANNIAQHNDRFELITNIHYSLCFSWIIICLCVYTYN